MIVNQRIDNALDWMNKYDIHVSDKVFQKYVDFTTKNIQLVESIVDRINKMGYVLTCDIPMYFTTNLSDLENIKLPDITIYKTPVNVSYSRTHVYNIGSEGVVDRYNIIFGESSNPTIDAGSHDELDAIDFINLIEKGGLVTEHGIIGINKTMFEEYLKKF
jgi:hypothetical protein